MERKVTITSVTTEERTLEEFWMLRGIRTNLVNGKKEVVVEREFERQPTDEDITNFLVMHKSKGIDFVSMTHNFRIDPLPFH